MSLPLALRVVESSARAYRRVWKGTVVTAFVNPILFLVAMGQGLGSLVETGAAVGLPPTTSYLDFLAPGLLAAAAMQTASTEATWPVMAGIKWRKTYHAALATPVRVPDLVTGNLVWITIRTLMACAVFALVMAVLGGVPAIRAAAAVPAAVLTGIAFGAPLAAYTAVAKDETRLSTIFRFAIIPMFSFSGTFFPVEQLPSWLQPVALVTPLWHGVELCRAAALGIAPDLSVSIHVAYLSVWAAAGWTVATYTFRKTLVR